MLAHVDNALSRVGIHTFTRSAPTVSHSLKLLLKFNVDGQGCLITNREIVSEDIDNFGYTLKEGYKGPFIIFNEPDKVSLIPRVNTTINLDS